MTVSVAMTTYNGSMYLEEQINSIMSQLSADDELIISDDGSTDGTLGIINKYLKDPKVKLFKNPQKGIVKNFENAISNTQNQIIILSDQDDVWLPNKVSTIKKEFSNRDIGLLISEAKYVDADLKEIDFVTYYRCWRKGIVANLIKNTYIGCCMAFRKELKEVVLPFPDNIPMHDVWIGILAEMNGVNIVHISEELILYRRHNATATTRKRNSLPKIFYWRATLLVNLLKRYIKTRLKSQN